MWLQESTKTKHPQLLYESKIYKILQGGSESPAMAAAVGVLPGCCLAGACCSLDRLEQQLLGEDSGLRVRLRTMLPACCRCVA